MILIDKYQFFIIIHFVFNILPTLYYIFVINLTLRHHSYNHPNIQPSLSHYLLYILQNLYTENALYIYGCIFYCNASSTRITNCILFSSSAYIVFTSCPCLCMLICSQPLGYPLYPLLITLLSFTITAPTFNFCEGLLELIRQAKLPKYSSQPILSSLSKIFFLFY